MFIGHCGEIVCALSTVSVRVEITGQESSLKIHGFSLY